MLYRLLAELMTDSDSYCPSCGQPAAQDDVACAGCGARLQARVGAPDTEREEAPWTVMHITAGLFLFLGLLFVSALVARGAGRLYPSQEPALEAWVAVHALAVSALGTVWVMGLRHADSPLLALRLVRPRSPVPAALLAVGALAFSIGATFLYGLVVDQLGIEALRPREIEQEIMFPGAGILLTLQALALVTPVSEEVLFRGFVLRGLLRNIGAGPAVVSTALVFAAFHLDPSTVIPIFFTGLALGFVYIRTGSLWPCIAAHAGQNALALLAVRAGL